MAQRASHSKSTGRRLRGETIYQAGCIVPVGRLVVKGSSRGISCIVSLLVLVAAVPAVAGLADAALRKPTYAAGNQWVYVLDGSLTNFPGFNASQGSFHFGFVGFVYVDVIGFAT